MATVYTGLNEQALLKIQAFLLQQLFGETFMSTNVPGLQSTRRLESRDAVRAELVIVNQTLADLDPEKFTAPKLIKRTQGIHSTYQVK